MADVLIRTATAANAERCLAVLALAFDSADLALGYGMIRNSTWRHSHALLEPSAEAAFHAQR